MDFRQILNHSLYEINKFGDVRKITTQKLIQPIDGNIKILTDEGKRTMRSVEKLVQDNFFPETGTERNVLRYVEGIGYIVDKAGLNSDDSLLGKLVSNTCDYKIKARKNYKDEVRFQFIGLMNEDKDAKCLLFNEDEDTTTLYSNEDEAIANKKHNDEIFYFFIHEGKNDLLNVDLLEHILNAKFYYIKSKLDEYDTEVDEAKLYKEYLKYDFEDRYDEYCEELSLPIREESIRRTVKVVNKGICGLEPLSDADLSACEQQKSIDKAEKYERIRIAEAERQKKEEREREMLQMEGDNIVRKVEGETKKALKKYNQHFGTNFTDIEGFVKDWKITKRLKENRAATAMRQREKDMRMQKRLTMKLNE